MVRTLRSRIAAAVAQSDDEWVLREYVDHGALSPTVTIDGRSVLVDQNWTDVRACRLELPTTRQLTEAMRMASR